MFINCFNLSDLDPHIIDKRAEQGGLDVVISHMTYADMITQYPVLREQFAYIFSKRGCACHMDGNLVYEKKWRDSAHHIHILKIVRLFQEFISRFLYPKSGRFVHNNGSYYTLSIIGLDATDAMKNEFRSRHIDIFHRLVFTLNKYIHDSLLFDKVVIDIHDICIYVYPTGFCEKQMIHFLSQRYCPKIIVRNVAYNEACFTTCFKF